ncbi:hypothetical protein KY290_028525 [Solanum tuberosum]|uniref:Uncharacterized protein n=1 Tax=Solanum tuberosum TaxID=4113 RepID=A0ABQ7UJC7_SOLTU|nr:hypothetical protein KY290_028525 [Solanum tuberosum]
MELLEDGEITTTVKDISIYLDEVTLGIILRVPVKGIRSIEGCKPSEGFTVLATKRGEVKLAGLPKKLLKGECQLLFEFINKSTLQECKCVEGPVKGRSQVAAILEQQATLTRERTNGSTEELQTFRDGNAQPMKTIAFLNDEVKALNKQVIKAHEDANERMLVFMCTFSPPLPPS